MRCMVSMVKASERFRSPVYMPSQKLLSGHDEVQRSAA